MNDFLILYAPFLIVLLSIGVSFWLADKDGAIRKSNKIKS